MTHWPCEPILAHRLPLGHLRECHNGLSMGTEKQNKFSSFLTCYSILLCFFFAMSLVCHEIYGDFLFPLLNIWGGEAKKCRNWLLTDSFISFIRNTSKTYLEIHEGRLFFIASHVFPSLTRRYALLTSGKTYKKQRSVTYTSIYCIC